MMRGMITVMAFWLAMIGGCMAARADEPSLPGITVTWTYPTHNEDGTALTALAGARLYIGTEPGRYTQMIEVPGGEPGQEASHRITTADGLQSGTLYYITGTAVSATGLESDMAPEIARTFVIETMPRIIIHEAENEVWRRVHEVVDGVYRARWERQ